MLTAEQMKTLKKVSIGKDAEKTKVRVAEDFKSTANENKNTIVELSGLTRSSFYRVFDTGAITPKVALSLAQTLNVSPYYYIGAVDDKGTCDAETLFRFLNEYGYGRLVTELKENMKPKRQYTRKPKTEPAPDVAKEEVSEPMKTVEPLETSTEEIEQKTDDETGTVNITLNNSPKMLEAVTNLTEDDAILLLKALIKRAEGGGNAEILCGLVKHCLLS